MRIGNGEITMSFKRILLSATAVSLFGCRQEELTETGNNQDTQDILHGVWLPPLAPNYVVSLEQIEAFEQSAEKPIGAHVYYVGWDDQSWDYVSAQLEVLDPLNIRAQIVWEPWDTSLDAIVSGSEDARIDTFAVGAREYGKPFFLRFAHEMNGDWYSWSGASNSQNPEKYIEAWQYIWNRFQENDATNVEWVWTPNWYSVPQESWNDLTNYYPGDQYVDWVGTDFYGLMWDDVPVSENIDSVYEHYSHKPIMIAETAAADCNNYIDGATRTKDQWIREFFETLPSYPSVKAFFWFNDTDVADWSITSCPSPDVQEAYSEGVSAHWYVGRP